MEHGINKTSIVWEGREMLILQCCVLKTWRKETTVTV